MGQDRESIHCDMIEILRFVCQLYGYNIDDVNLLRYKIYCAKRGSIIERISPCLLAWYQHTLCASYQSYIWKLLLASPPQRYVDGKYRMKKYQYFEWHVNMQQTR